MKVIINLVNNTDHQVKLAKQDIKNGQWLHLEYELAPHKDGRIEINSENPINLGGEIVYKLIDTEKTVASLTLTLLDGGKLTYTDSMSPRHAPGLFWYDSRIALEEADNGLSGDNHVIQHSIVWEQYPNPMATRLRPIAVDYESIPLPPDTVQALVHSVKGDPREGCVDIRCPELSSDGIIYSVKKEIYQYNDNRDNLSFSILYRSEEMQENAMDGLFPRKYTGPDMQYRLIVHTSSPREETKTYVYRS
ncbi:hypothetical protein E9536_40450 [Burkholderia sp. LS-044]|uniref:hypothetical protein n=1 Tax=Burkholderia sp. LS-044 TaxID=1459967 RepID=UPI0010A683C0|nr:hypothetical protein [Burkholderia sp. LS-044]THJ46014.1 hypothetical protein E9536_40450 [Burkholderia sp. LS-044]